MYSAPLERSVVFPLVPGARRGEHRFRASRLYSAFEDLGDVALSALHNNDGGVVIAGESAIEFLGSLTRFIVGDGSTGSGQAEAYAPGDHTFEYRFVDRDAGLQAARRGLEMTSGEYPVSSLVVGYTVACDRSQTMPVSEVQVRVGLEGHPHLAGHYGRLSGDVSFAAEPQCTLRTAMGDVTHRGLLVPDMGQSIHALAGMAEKFDGVQGTRVG